MDRRDIIRSMGLISAHALFPSVLSGFLASCSSPTQEGAADYTPTFFSKEEFGVIKETIDLILPATKTASASQVNTHHFLDEVFAKCMNNDQQRLIKKGLSSFVNEFTNTSDKEAFLQKVDWQAFSGHEDYGWFRPIKQYTLIGFFTSKEGTTKASNYVPVPGDYKGDIPLEKSTLNYGLTGQHYYI